jgi:hypothetical protein
MAMPTRMWLVLHDRVPEVPGEVGLRAERRHEAASQVHSTFVESSGWDQNPGSPVGIVTLDTM